MYQLEDFEDSSEFGFPYKLQKALYDLRQLPRAWYDKLKSALVQWGFSNAK